MRNELSNVGVWIGAHPDSVKELRAAINEILRASVDQTTMVAALDVLKTGCAVNNATLSDCNIKQGGAK